MMKTATSARCMNIKPLNGGFSEILTMTEGTNTKYLLTDALGSVTAVCDAVIAGLKGDGSAYF